MGTKRILGYLAKFWVNGHCLSEKCRNFGVFMSFWPCQEWKTFSKCHKSQYFCICTYKYQIFWLFKWFLHFQSQSDSRVSAVHSSCPVPTWCFFKASKSSIKQPNIFFYPKFLEFFLPLKTPLKVKNSNLSESPFFLGHPVSSLVTSLPGSFLQSAIQSSYQYC